jgi:hypothetical protein
MPVIGVGDLLDLLGAQLVGARRQDRADDRSGRRAGHPLDRIPGFHQRDGGAWTGRFP